LHPFLYTLRLWVFSDYHIVPVDSTPGKDSTTHTLRNGMSNNDDDHDGASLEAYLSRLTPTERAEAMAAAAAAQRAEERAEERAEARALEQALRIKQEQHARLDAATAKATNKNTTSSSDPRTSKLVFVSKRQRDQPKEVPNPERQEETMRKMNGTDVDRATHSVRPASLDDVSTDAALALSEKERLAVMETYLGKSATEQEEDHVQKRKKLKVSKKTTFKFRWDETDDTSNFNDEEDPLYAPLVPPSASSSRATNHKPHYGRNRNDHNNRPNPRLHQRIMHPGTAAAAAATDSSMASVMKKPIATMTARDWRIVRENFEITVKGGRAPPPLRSFGESPAPGVIPTLHPSLLEAIQTVLRFAEPSPIQRQAIPIGLQRRDLIGISETGSGKTVAFGVPMCHYILNLPPSILSNVADQGPLALVMAPTRELALQIDVELQKLLSCQTTVISCAIVGGQPIQQQAQVIRKGVHIVVGTPGRINECIEMAYLVLNQCCYIVVDEGDRLIDMGFAPQMESMYVGPCGRCLRAGDTAAISNLVFSPLRALTVSIPLRLHFSALPCKAWTPWVVP
jgi:ATP-dependent RNA helicase DDX23/PRP28